MEEPRPLAHAHGEVVEDFALPEAQAPRPLDVCVVGSLTGVGEREGGPEGARETG